jgi:hypothetical protein
VVTFLIIKSVFSETYNHPIMFMMLGIVMALTYRISQETGAFPAPQTVSGRVGIRGYNPALRPSRA